MSRTEPQGCLAAILSLFGINIRGPAAINTELPFRLRDDFLTAAELSFYRVLVNAVGNQAIVFPKVNLADIFFVVRPNDNRSYRNKIDRKHVDFLLCDPATMRLQCGVELDDSSHGRRGRQERDVFVDQVFNVPGLSLVRVPVKSAYSPAGLLALLEPHLIGTPVARSLPSVAPNTGSRNCSKCGIPMVERVVKKGHNAGQRFLGCANYPKCKEVATIKD